MQWQATWEIWSNFLQKNHAEACAYCMAAVCLPIHGCSFSDSILLTLRSLTMMITVTYLLTLHFLFAFSILHFTHGFWYILLSMPTRPTTRSHSFKSNGILKVLEAKQTNQILNDIRILQVKVLFLKMFWRKTSWSFIRSNQLLNVCQLQSKSETLALQYVEHNAKC